MCSTGLPSLGPFSFSKKFRSVYVPLMYHRGLSFAFSI
ncbi:unnamed protein product [Linum tenue]|uniref:Uncharacterized protein n=1 Tax=Linum tenue TaxID=586396 RepID=A0AAV0HS93_9ROSI|nr:unnamed protein product [Linum tenue]